MKWLTLVNCAIVTALRRNVLLSPLWEDVDWTNRVIKIKPTYWRAPKKAPLMVPLSKFLENQLREYYSQLPEQYKNHKSPIFPNNNQRTKTKWRPAYRTTHKWTDDAWMRIIKRTDLWEPYTNAVTGEIMYDKNGETVKDYLTFHDLRHTATTRYAEPPYSLDPTEYEYFKGNKIKYVNPQHIDINNRIRDKIDKGDTEHLQTVIRWIRAIPGKSNAIVRNT